MSANHETTDDGSFGEILQKLRKNRRISQRNLAAYVGIDHTYLSKIENGAMPPPGYGTLLKLAEALDIDSDPLLLRAGKIPRDVGRILLERPHLLKVIREHGESPQ